MNAAADRARYIDGLRILAQVLQDHPEVPLPYQGRHDGTAMSFHFFGGEPRAAMAAAARALPCALRKEVRGYSDAAEDSYLDLVGALAGVQLRLTAFRDAVCTRRVTGVEDREVEEVVTPAVTQMVTKPVEVVEWDCHPLLAPGPAAAVAGG